MGNCKVMATLTPARCGRELISRLVSAGMEGVRINSAHVEPSDIRRMVAEIRGVDPAQTILMDTKGPEVRSTDVAEPQQLRDGCRVKISCGDCLSTARHIFLNAKSLAGFIGLGETLLIDDGAIRLVTDSVSADGETVEATVTCGGTL